MRNWLVIWYFLIGQFSISQIDQSIFLIARNTGKKVMSNGDTIRTMGYAYELTDNPTVPSPLLEMFEGDSIEIDMWNVSQGHPHTIHLHGLDVNQENDGVPHLSFDVDHMDHGFYYFKAPHAGTYLYHCHVVSPIHLQGGMYGMIIVHPKNEENHTWTDGYEYEFDASLLFSEIDTIWHNDTIIKHDTTSMMVHIPDYYPQFYLANGLSDDQIDDSLEIKTAVDAITYVRLGNMGYKGNRVIFPSEFNATIIDSDGRPLPSVEVSDTVYLWPGERYGVIGSMPAEGEFELVVDYLDMNSDSLENTQYIPIIVEGFSETISTSEEMEHRVYPNPANNWLHVETTEENALFFLYDQSGRIALSTTISGNTGIDVHLLAKGTYVYRIIGKEQATGKIILE